MKKKIRCFKITLSKREKLYVTEMLNQGRKNDDNTESIQASLSEEQQYDLNYRLKKKFETIHEDYWLLVQFFKQYNTQFELRKTKRTEKVLNIAKSQIASQEMIHTSKCEFCLRTNDSKTQIREHNICEECFSQFTTNK